MELFSKPLFPLVEQSLSHTSLKQKVISQNVANVDTPNYKAKEVVFKNELQQALNKFDFQANRTDARHYEFHRTNKDGASIHQDLSTQMNNNGNNVDIDKEMSEMAKNQIYYNALVEGLNQEFNKLKLVARGGR